MTAVAEYRYDAMGRRIEYIDHTRGTTTRYYYDGSNVIAEYDYTEPGGTPTETLARTYYHGSQYIDERAVMRDHTASDEDHYYLLEELYTVAGLAAANGMLEEAYVYGNKKG